MEAITMVAVDKLTLADDNVRDELGDVSEMAASIKSVGVIEPLLVRKDGMLVVCGARRLAAARSAGLAKVPVILGSYTDEERLTVMAIENLQRESLSPLEEARVYARLRDLSLTTRQVADRIGVSQSWVVKRLSLLKLPADAQAAVSSGKLEIGQAQELVKVADDAKLVSKLVKKVTAPDGAGRSITIDVQAALTGREEAKAAAAKAKELTKAGETVVPLKLDYYNAEPPEGMKLVQPNGYSKHDLRFDVEKHRKLSCHAVGVHPKTAAVIEVCTAPGKHPDPAKQRQAEEEKRQQERAAEQERKQRERDHQIEFLTAAAVKPSKEIVLEAAYLALAGDGGYSYTDGELALALLGIEEPEEELVPSNPDENFDFVQEAVDKLAATPAGKLRVTFAYAADRLWGLGDLDHLLDHLGYEPPKGKAAKPKPEPEAKKPEKPEATEEVVDLMEALRRSVGSAEADQADVDAGEAEGEVVGEHTEDISHKH